MRYVNRLLTIAYKRTYYRIFEKKEAADAASWWSFSKNRQDFSRASVLVVMSQTSEGP